MLDHADKHDIKKIKIKQTQITITSLIRIAKTSANTGPVSSTTGPSTLLVWRFVHEMFRTAILPFLPMT